jgi:AcrR family transcriptional regulator
MLKRLGDVASTMSWICCICSGVPSPLMCAIDLFYAHGFHAIGLDRIIAETGVTKTTFYKHFESKDALVIAAIRMRDDWETRAWNRAVRKLAGNDPRRQLLAVFDVLDLWFNEPSFAGCLFLNAAAEFADPREPAHQAAAAHKKRTRDDWCALARRAGAVDPETFADLYTALFEGTLIMRHVHGRNDAARITRPMIERLIGEHMPGAGTPRGAARSAPR